MIHLSRQPFLLSLRQEVAQTSQLEGHRALLYAQQGDFKEYVSGCCEAEIPVFHRFRFLKLADYELGSIRLYYAERVRKRDVDYYRCWSMLITDTQRFIAVCVETVNFQTTCPVHLIEIAQPSPTYHWIGQRVDLSETMVGIYQTDLIRMADGRRPSFAHFAKCIGGMFGVPYETPYDDFRKVVNRKRNPAPFLQKMIDGIKGKK